MAESTTHWDYFQDLYRFAVILTRNPETSRKLVTDTLDEVLKKTRPHFEQERLKTLLFQNIRRRALKVVPAEGLLTSSSTTRKSGAGARGSAGRGEGAPSSFALPAGADEVFSQVDTQVVASAFHTLAEPGRSALAMLYLDALDADAIGKMLDLGIAELSDAVQAARLALHEACLAAAGTGAVSP